MSQDLTTFLARKLRTAALLAISPGVAAFVGCTVQEEALDVSSDGALATTQQALIGGQPASENEYRSTVGIGDACTATKVGARLFLTAAHCVAIGRPGRGQTIPEDYPQNGGVRADYLAGSPLAIRWGLNADDAAQAVFTIVRTSIHPSWWSCPACQDPLLGPGGAADIAVIEIAENTSQIPEANVDVGAVEPGAALVKVGWGCEVRTNVDPSTVELGRYKRANAALVAASQILHESSPITEGQVAVIDASYLVTAGHAQSEANASLCLGDSGGPLYLAGNGVPRVVGVNSDYSFRPSGDPGDLGGVSWTDWHTRTSLTSLHGVGQWLIDLGVNQIGGEPSTSHCTCPQGCTSVKRASLPFTSNGPVGGCYFFEKLGQSVNSHTMVEVNLNGRNVTNRWVGAASFPAVRDGGYYLYLKGQRAWSWAQALGN